MPDSYPPFSWGPPPFEERDLDALLSGETADIPFALRQVADALAALRAAPAQAELSGEAVVMAEFSAVAEFRAAALSEAAPAAGQAHTLELPAVPAAPGTAAAHRRGARHRIHRGGRRPLSPRPLNGRPLSRRAGVVVAGAVAAVIVATAAVAANLHGPSHAHPSQTVAAPSTAQSGAGGGGSAAARSASAVPTSRPSSAHDAAPLQSQPRDGSSAKQLCRTYFGYFKNPEPKSKWAAEFDLFGQLSELAGGPLKVFKFCKPYVKDMFPSGFKWPLTDPDNQQHGQPNSGPDSQGISKKDQGGGGPPQPNPPGSPSQRP
jgi:hypothetical protein